MAYKALYRTYRPSSFDEVAGQQHIVKTIKNALKTSKLSHAYLFTGPRGTGKTTMAKLLAKALNCEHGIGCQCNECKNCKAIIDGTHPDVLELDAASNNSVEDIRDLIDKVKYGTILGRYKVYIIDEVHMLSTGAFNALLKTLEEPPEHVIFVLATTEPHKILPTILSRCQRYDFSRVSDNDIKERLRVVLSEEGIPFNEKAVDLIVSLADGGMRDALSILDQVLRYSGDKLDKNDIMDVFAIESLEEKISFITSIIDSDSKDVLNRLSKYIAKGTDIKRLTDDLLEIFKDVLIYKNTMNEDYLTTLDSESALNLSSALAESEIMEMINSLLDAQKNYKNVPSINSLFQVTVLKMSTICKQKNKIDNNEKCVEEPKPVIEKQIPQPAPVQEPKQTAVVEPIINEPEPIVVEKPEVSVPKEEPAFTNIENEISIPEKFICLKNSASENYYVINDEQMLNVMVSSKKELKNSLNSDWQKLKQLTAHPLYGKAAATLLDAHILVASNQILILEFALTKTANRANEIGMQKDLQIVINSIFNRQMFVYSVDRNTSIKAQQNFLNRLQIGKLPKLNTFTLEMEDIN